MGWIPSTLVHVCCMARRIVGESSEPLSFELFQSGILLVRQGTSIKCNSVRRLGSGEIE